jgi:DNA-binding NarL/FixJ family response regulator
LLACERCSASSPRDCRTRAIAAQLFITERTVEAHSKQIFAKLRLDANPSSHRRVLAVLAHLRGSP